MLSEQLSSEFRSRIESLDSGDLTDKALSKDMDHLSREKVFAAFPALQRQLTGLVEQHSDLLSGAGGALAHLLEAIENLGPERHPKILELLKKLEPHLEPGRPVEAWARCVAALRLRELAPVVARRTVSAGSSESLLILAVALGSLGTGTAAPGKPPVWEELIRQLSAGTYVREALAGLALGADPLMVPGIVRGLPERVALASGGAQALSSERAWLRTLALGEFPPGSVSRWSDSRALGHLRRLSDARRGELLPDTGGGGRDPDFEEALGDRMALQTAASTERSARVGRKAQELLARLAAAHGGRGGPVDRGASELEPVAYGLLEAADGHARIDQRTLRDLLQANLVQTPALVFLKSADPVRSLLGCLGKHLDPWDPPTTQLVSDIARGRANGSRELDSSGWLRQLHAVESLGSRLVRADALATQARDTLLSCLAAPHSAVRWAALCALSRTDGPLARRLDLPGPGATSRRVDALGVWHRSGLQFDKGEELLISAHGAWRIARERFDWTDAEGYEPDVEQRLWRAAGPGDKLRPERFGRMTLEGRVGNHAFRIGRSRRLRLEDRGELLLRPWIPLDGDELEFDGGPALAWMSGLGPSGQPAAWSGMRGFLTVAVERRPGVPSR